MRLPLVPLAGVLLATTAGVAADPLKLHCEKDYLRISGDHLPGKEIKIHELEAYCRAGSTDADWVTHTMVGHETRLVEANADGTLIRLEDVVKDSVRVSHEIRSALGFVQSCGHYCS